MDNPESAMLTFNRVRNVLAIDMRCQQPSRIIANLPFVVDNALQLHFGTSVIVFSNASNHCHIGPVRLETVLLLVRLEHAVRE